MPVPPLVAQPGRPPRYVRHPPIDCRIAPTAARVSPTTLCGSDRAASASNRSMCGTVPQQPKQAVSLVTLAARDRG